MNPYHYKLLHGCHSPSLSWRISAMLHAVRAGDSDFAAYVAREVAHMASLPLRQMERDSLILLAANNNARLGAEVAR